jgi:hypothetical protein
MLCSGCGRQHNCITKPVLANVHRQAARLTTLPLLAPADLGGAQALPAEQHAAAGHLVSAGSRTDSAGAASRRLSSVEPDHSLKDLPNTACFKLNSLPPCSTPPFVGCLSFRMAAQTPSLLLPSSTLPPALPASQASFCSSAIALCTPAAASCNA